MYNCIFSGHCINMTCDKSCPILVETSYLMNRNGLSMNSDVFNRPKEEIDRYSKFIDSATGKLKVFVDKSNNSVSVANLLTYIGICKNWKGSQLHCTVYNLRYFQYLEMLKKSWSDGSTEQLEYTKIWADTAKLLIISNINYVNFKNFESQTLLELIQSRASKADLTTIVVSPPISALVGENSFYLALKDILGKAIN